MAAVSLALASCGHTAKPPPATPTRTPIPADVAAMAGGHVISDRTVTTYVRYAAGFFTAAFPGESASTTSTCSQTPAAGACETLRIQVLARLLQQRVVLDYAKRRHITLSADDRIKVSDELKQLLDPDSDTAGLYPRDAATKKLLRHILKTQALVVEVENSIAGPKSLSGLAYHVRKYVVPAGHHAKRMALALATDGKPVPPRTVETTAWEAPFRLPEAVSHELSLARPGEFVGPFKRSSGYLVIRLLKSGNHRYGLPARAAILTAAFQSWLRVAMTRARLTCYHASERDACKLAIPKTQ